MFFVVPALLFVLFLLVLAFKNGGYEVRYNESGSKRDVKVTASYEDLQRLTETFRAPISPEKGNKNPEHIHIKLPPIRH